MTCKRKLENDSTWKSSNKWENFGNMAIERKSLGSLKFDDENLNTYSLFGYNTMNMRKCYQYRL